MQLATLGRLPNVVAAGGFSYFQTRVWVGERRVKALVVGVPDWAHQQVNVVSVVSGTAPTAGVLSDVQNAKQGRFSGSAGDTIRIVGVGDRTLTVPVSGVGRNMIGGQQAGDGSLVVLYSTPAVDRAARCRIRASAASSSGFVDTEHCRCRPDRRCSSRAT